MMRRFAVCFFVAGMLAVAGCGGGPGIEGDDLRIAGGKLFKSGDDEHTVRGFRTAVPASRATDLSVVVPALCKTASVGGNTICVLLDGFNDDCTLIDPVVVAGLSDFAKRTKDQHMRFILWVAPDTVPEQYLEQAVRTVAATFKDGRILYGFRPGQGDLVRIFRELAPNFITAGPEGAHLVIGPEAAGPLGILDGKFEAAYEEQKHFLLPDEPAFYAQLDEAKRRPVEKAPWTPDNSLLSEAEAAEGFVSLFNGKDLSGWGFQRGETEGSYHAEDGLLACAGTSGPTLYSRDRYRNYILRFDFRIVQGGNSGCFQRAPRECRQSKIGFEFQILGDHGEPVSDTSTGSIYSVLPPAVNAGNPGVEWNSVEIYLDGPKYRATLNGQVVQDVNFDDVPELKYRLRTGFIALQDHGAETAYRNIRIKTL